MGDCLILPSSGRTTGKKQPGFFYRQPDFGCLHVTSVFGADFSGQHIGKNSRSKAGCVGIDEEEQRFLGQKLYTELNQRMNTILNLPDLSLWAAAIGRRIHDNGIIVIPPADFSFNKFYTVIHQPADRSLRQPGGHGIFLCPAYHAFGGIHMGDGSACPGCSQCGASRVGEQV